MGWNVSLERDGEPVEVSPHRAGGVQSAKVNDDGRLEAIDNVLADMSVTYNYSGLFRHALEVDFDELNGRRASDVAPILTAAAVELGTDRDDDYWKPTEGNVGFILSQMAAWSRQHPDAVWRIS